MTRLIFRLAGVEAERSQTLAGAPLAVPLPWSEAPLELEVTRPSGTVLRVPVPKAKGQVFRYADTHEVGTYLFRVVNAKESKLFACAVNLDPDECDAATVSQEELTKRFGQETLVFCDNPTTWPAPSIATAKGGACGNCSCS
jgi:hypothetical protein